MDAELRFAQQKDNAKQKSLYAEYKKDIKSLKVTPLLLPYDVQQETCKELDKALEFKPDGCDVTYRCTRNVCHSKVSGQSLRSLVWMKKVTGTPCISQTTLKCL